LYQGGPPHWPASFGKAPRDMSEIDHKAVLFPGWVWLFIIVLTVAGGIFYSSVWLFAGVAAAVAGGAYRIIVARWPASSGRLRVRTRFLICFLLASAFALHYQREFDLQDLSKVPLADRDRALANWERVEQAFKAKDSRSLEALIGCKVLIRVDANGSPWTGKALSGEERAVSAGDGGRLAGARGENATEIATELRNRREKAWQVDCRIGFTKKQVRRHFIWPDAVFSADFDLLGTITKASISGHSVRIEPVAIQPMILQL